MTQQKKNEKTHNAELAEGGNDTTVVHASTAPHDDPNRCCARQFCRTTLDLWREQDRLLRDIADELGVEQPDQILPAIADRAKIEHAAFHVVMQWGAGTEEDTRKAVNALEGLFADIDEGKPLAAPSATTKVSSSTAASSAQKDDLRDAAPDLLEALKAAQLWTALQRSHMNEPHTHPQAIVNIEEDMAKIEAAIQKATGGRS